MTEMRGNILGNLEAHFESLDHLICGLLGRRILQLRVLFLSRFFELEPLGDVEGAGPEQPVYFLFKFRNVVFVESVLEHLGREDHHRFVKVLIGFLI